MVHCTEHYDLCTKFMQCLDYNRKGWQLLSDQSKQDKVIMFVLAANDVLSIGCAVIVIPRGL